MSLLAAAPQCARGEQPLWIFPGGRQGGHGGSKGGMRDREQQGKGLGEAGAAGTPTHLGVPLGTPFVDRGLLGFLDVGQNVRWRALFEHPPSG